MTRHRPVSVSAVLLGLLLFCFPVSEARAFSASESKLFHHGPYAFKMEISLNGNGSLKKANPIPVSSLKLKIKNEKANSEALKVKTIRVYLAPGVFRDIETRDFSVTPGQWVTKYFRLRKETQPLLGEKGYVEIGFENFSIQFHPRERKFHGPV
jgi:hypothetical protein